MNWKLFLPLAGLACVALLPPLICQEATPPSKPNQTSQPGQQNPRVSKRPRAHSAEAPVARYETADKSASDARRAEKNRRMDFLLPSPLEDPIKYEKQPRVSTSSVFVDAISEKRGLPSLEVPAIVVGRVLGGTAFISKGKTGVYSEFQIAVEDVLKQDASAPMTLGEKIVITRRGGTVQYPSGHVQRIIYEGLGYPAVNSIYLFFLWKTGTWPDPHDYGLYTAYELRDGRAYALDDGPQFDQYEGADAPGLLSTIRLQLAAAAREGGKESKHSLRLCWSLLPP